MQHRMAQRKRSRVGERRHERDETSTGEMQHERETREAGAHDGADFERRRLPRRQTDERERHDKEYGDAQPVLSPLPRFIAQQQRRFDEPNLQQRHDGEQQRDEHADADALQRGAKRDAVVRLREQRRRFSEREWNGADGNPRDRHAEEAARQAERHHLKNVNGNDLRVARADALENRDAFDFLQDEHACDARDGDAA
jgi:hypothetical protein